ncbi:MAG: type II secretion system ATPase GspE [Candidatus Dadabacteria bacterium]|nr:type II secretion system ATPase GspE [Candidatus Dadabacteria bacterium]NIS07360.1 type II secretion system ATPase GspE [Candidatus Dadabacteria bacterium]NIV41304.1 type II secretion system ATPase GspE [Candidatus Dadabacteria bacterium]NIX14539.1 type II secretion system ATPase GspE [Candidatus Dadabacteria bacterium]NIY20997.1 type II secretion system ATPase GspE [Candidatus Dadabacteria bacterium]
MRSLQEILIDRNPELGSRIKDILTTSEDSAEEAIIRSNILNDKQILEAFSEYYELPFRVSIFEKEIDPELAQLIPIAFAKKNRIIPLNRDNNKVYVAISPPLDLYSLDELKSLFNCDVEPFLSPSHVVLDCINKVYERDREVTEDIEGDVTGISEAEFQEPKDLLEAEDEAPIIRFVNSLLFQAVKEKASDIHVECFEKDVVIRFRKDGMLHKITEIPKKLQSSVISRLKIMAELDIAERRKPQDGRIRVKVAGRDVDVRISTVPTSWGESVVMRLLDRSSVLLSLEDLGVTGQKLSDINNFITRPHGIILVTGPTGSGKTTTLYASLVRINSPDKKIITIEDPVEYQLQGVNQIQVNTKVNLSFANGLRSILRQDPDVILVGEIRDRETADIAIHASLTGHLVFSTLHTNDSASAITRLIDMGIEPFLVSSSLMAVVAQRLVRHLCNSCKEEYTPTDEELEKIGIQRASILNNKLYRSTGCEECLDTGFAGRSGIFEILKMDDDIRNLTLQSTDSSTIKKKAVERGLTTLRGDGIAKILRGQTSIDEVLRVTEQDEI